MAFGLMTTHDATVLERSIKRVVERFPDTLLKFCEIGVNKGDTSRGVRDVLVSLGAKFAYWCVDLGLECKEIPFPGANFVWGDSTEVHYAVPGDLHFVLVDGCHCLNHAMLDVLLYSRKLVQGGELLVHDTHPCTAPYRDYQHGPRDRPESYIAVRQALEYLGLLPHPPPNWVLVDESADENQKWGGFTVFKRMV